VRVVWSPLAVREIARIFEYLFEFNPRAAEHVAHALVEAGESLSRFPRRGRLVARTDKRELVTAYPYVIRYRVAGDVVRVLRVRHTSRRPTNP